MTNPGDRTCGRIGRIPAFKGAVHGAGQWVFKSTVTVVLLVILGWAPLEACQVLDVNCSCGVQAPDLALIEAVDIVLKDSEFTTVAVSAEAFQGSVLVARPGLGPPLGPRDWTCWEGGRVPAPVARQGIPGHLVVAGHCASKSTGAIFPTGNVLMLNADKGKAGRGSDVFAICLACGEINHVIEVQAGKIGIVYVSAVAGTLIGEGEGCLFDKIYPLIDMAGGTDIPLPRVAILKQATPRTGGRPVIGATVRVIAAFRCAIFIREGRPKTVKGVISIWPIRPATTISLCWHITCSGCRCGA